MQTKRAGGAGFARRRLHLNSTAQSAADSYGNERKEIKANQSIRVQESAICEKPAVGSQECRK